MIGSAAAFTVAIAACGGGDSGSDAPAPAPAPAPAATPSAASSAGPAAADWVTVDEGAQTVTIDLTAGATDANIHWNYNGYSKGEATVVVPVGYTVTVNFQNADPVNFHSFAVLDAAGSFPATFSDATPVFDGAMTPNALSMTEATPAGGSESITFTASTAGDYALVCLIPAHAVTGMWIGFEVSASGDSGVRM